MTNGWQRLGLVVGGALGAFVLLLMSLETDFAPSLLLFYIVAVFIFIGLGCGVAWVVEGFRGRR